MFLLLQSYVYSLFFTTLANIFKFGKRVIHFLHHLCHIKLLIKMDAIMIHTNRNRN